MPLSSKRIAAVALMAGAVFALLTGSALAAPPWSDAPNSFWVDGYGVTDTEVAGVADGYLDGKFKPAQAVNRGQFAKMAVSGLDLATVDPSTPTFMDVAKGSTFYTFVEGACDEGLVTGFPVTGGLEYRPLNNISRQQANSILGRYLSDAEGAATGVIHGPAGMTYGSLSAWYNVWGEFYLDGFDDGGSVAGVHRPATAYLIYHGIVQGSGDKLNPLATLVRSQAAVMVLRVAEEAAEITTAPPAPTSLSVVPASPDNDATPTVNGQTIPGGIVHVYDSLNGAAAVDLFAGVPDAVAPRADSGGFFTANLPSMTDGHHVFTAKVKNANGLVSPHSTSSVAYLLDTIAPTGVVTAPVAPALEPDAAVNAAKPTFVATAADELSGVVEVQFQVAVDEESPEWKTVDTADEAVGGAYQADWSDGDLAVGLDDGQYLFRAIVYDQADNEKTLGPIEVTVDTNAPAAQIATGSLEPVEADGVFYTATRRPTFGASANDMPGGGVGTLSSGVIAVDFFYAPLASNPDGWEDFTLISTASGASGSADYELTLPAGIPDGRYLFAVRATDRAGNQSPLLSASGTYVAGLTRQVVIDNVDPTGTITSPLPGWVNSATPVFAVPAGDVTAGVRQVEFQYAIDSPTPVWISVSSDATAPYDAAWGSLSLTEGGGYLLRAIVTDKSGRTYTVPEIEVTVDTAAPSGSVTAPTHGLTVTAAQPAFTAGASDVGGSGVMQVEFQYAVSSGTPAWTSISSDNTDPYAAVWGMRLLNEGTSYLLRAIVTDNAGNSLSTPSVTIGVDLP